MVRKRRDDSSDDESYRERGGRVPFESFTWREPSTLPEDERKAYEERKAKSDAEIEAFVQKQRDAIEDYHRRQHDDKLKKQNERRDER